jgi:hypothetical protein
MTGWVNGFAGVGIALILSVTQPKLTRAYWPLKAIMGLLYLGMVQHQALDGLTGSIFLAYYLGDLVLGIPAMELRTKIQWGIGLFGLGHGILGLVLSRELDGVMIGLLMGILFFSYLSTVRLWIRTLNLEGLMGPVNGYVLILMAVGVMGWMAAPTTGLLALGITLFIVSDGFLALWHFKRKPWVGFKVLNILCYYTAIVLMITSL